MTSRPLVSVVIPVLNAESCIRDSIGSALGQTYRNIEVIVVDNGSTDGTCEIVRGLSAADERIRLIYSGRTGVSHARNVGIDEACGSYVTFCDADDRMEKGMIASLVSNMRSAHVVAGGMLFDSIDVSHRRVLASVPRQVRSEISGSGLELFDMFEELWDRNYLQSCWSKLYSLDFLRSNCIRFDERLSSYEDLSFVLECLAHGAKFLAIPEICYRYLRSSNVTNSSRYKHDMTDQMQNVAEKVTSFYEKTFRHPWSSACAGHVVQLLVVSINNAAKTPSGLAAARQSVADAFARRVFSTAVLRARRFPNAYSYLVAHLGVRRCYGIVTVLARLRNLIRGWHIAR